MGYAAGPLRSPRNAVTTLVSLKTRAVGVFHKMDSHEQNDVRVNPQTAAADEFPISETHGIALWHGHRLILDSRGLGWRDIYTSLASERPWSHTLHAVPHYCLAYCAHRAAAVTRVVEGERIDRVDLRPRLFGVVPADRASGWNLRGTPGIQLIYLRRSMVDRLAGELLEADTSRLDLLPRMGFSDPMLEQLVLALLDAARSRETGSAALYADHLARMIAVHVLRRHSSFAGRSIPLVDRFAAPAARMAHVRDLIDASLDEDLSLERLATEAGISSHAFSAAFVRTFGATPHRYVVQRRIERAKELLAGTDLPIASIALQTGFSSQSHLATAFKAVVGVSPSQYRGAGGRR